MLVKPVEGRLVRDPVTMFKLPDAGITVDAGDLFWARAAGEGDVTLEPDAPAPAAPTVSRAASAAPAPEAN